uniref:L1 transposable element dsRBD-like domain-containing protein n=1 Tax=Sus scrofa TaxID=9823 RepID=A0A8D2CEM0_PIG
MLKTKRKYCKQLGERNNIDTTLKRLLADFSAETLQTRREWHDILQVMKGKNLQPRLPYPARLSFIFEGEIKSFADKEKLRELSSTKPALQQILKKILLAEKKRPQLETKILQMTRLTSKGINIVKVGNHPHINMLPKSEIVRRGGY